MDTTSIDTDLKTLQDNKDRWAELPIVDKIAHLDAIKANTVRLARRWVELAVEAKGLTMDDPRAGEEWTGGPFSVLWLLRDLRTTLVRLSSGVPVLDGYTTRALPSGQVAVDVFPRDLDEALLFSGVTAQVWMQPDVTLETLEASTAGFYRGKDSGDVRVVLGAGNVSSIAVLDVVHAMFNDGAVALLKMNPVNDYLGPVFEEIFADLVSEGFVRFAYGGADVGEYLTEHDDVESVHITGGIGTYNTIVFGPGPDGEARRATDSPRIDKPVLAELGGVTPVMVVPGKWSAKDIRFQAEHIVSQKMHNSGFNCIGAQVLVLAEEWDQADDLVDAIREVLSETPGRQPYYPGSSERSERMAAASDDVEVIGGVYPKYLIPHVDADETSSTWFTTETFGPMLAVTRLAGKDPGSFLANAVDFANSTLSGTLGANLLIDPATARGHQDELDQALSDLDYGTIAVNAWSGVAYFMSKCAWGAFPGHTRADVGSGIGFVHNALMFDKPQKSIVTGPFAPAPRTFAKGDFHLGPKMVYFVTNKQAHVVGEKLIDYCDRPTKRKLASIALSASRG